MKRTRIQRRTPLRSFSAKAKPGAALKRRARPRCRSVKRAEDEQKYSVAKAEYQRAHPRCQMPGCTRSLLKGDIVDLHHKAGRNGPLLYCQTYFSSLCREHHDYVGEHKTWARANGWIIDVSSEEIRQLRLAEILAE